MTSPSRGQYNRRGATDLKPDSHEFWRLFQKRVALKWSWEQIAAEIGCDVDDLSHWANYVYTYPEKPKVGKIDVRRIQRVLADDLPVHSPLRRALNVRNRASEGARKTREALGA